MGGTEFIVLNNDILKQSANVLSLYNRLMVMNYQEWEDERIPKGDYFPYFEVIVVYSGIRNN